MSIPLFFVTTLCSFVMLSNTCLAKEFEGVVTYAIKIYAENKSVNISAAKKGFGKEHVFYYKDGAHKWVSGKGTPFHYEIYNPKTEPNYIYSKYRDVDSIFASNVYESKDSLYRISDLDDQVVANKICKGYTFHIKNEHGKVFLRRTWFCPTSGMVFEEGRYENYKANGQNSVVDHCGSVPLKIVLEWPGRQFAVVYEAVKIEEITLDDALFELDKTIPVSYTYEND